MIVEYEALENKQLLDFYKMLKILKLTPMGKAQRNPTIQPWGMENSWVSRCAIPTDAIHAFGLIPYGMYCHRKFRPLSKTRL